MSLPHGESPRWTPERPSFSAGELVLAWLLGAVSLFVAALLLPGSTVSSFGVALVAAAVIAVLNAFLPPLVAALRLPFTALLGFFAILFVDAGMLLLTDRVATGPKVVTRPQPPRSGRLVRRCGPDPAAGAVRRFRDLDQGA